MHSLLKLSFSAARADGTIDLWPDTPSTGSVADDNDSGRQRADELVAYMQEFAAPMVFGHIISRISERGTIGSLEVGFFSQMALHSMAVQKLTAQAVVPAVGNVVPFVRPATSRR